MPVTRKTPGEFIQEKNAFPNSVVAVETAVPIFIGYTQKAEHNGKSILHKPTRISSFKEYVEFFGTGFNAKFKVAEAPAGFIGETFVLNGKTFTVEINDKNTLYFYSGIRFFYSNGGANCYIMSVGTYGDKPGGLEIDLTDFSGNGNKPDVFSILEKEYEPTLIVMPDIIDLGKESYKLYQLALEHAAKTQNRFAIFDVVQAAGQNSDDDIAQFRNGIGTTALNYGAAYYPWLKTSIVEKSEIDFTNLDASVDLANLLPERDAKQIAAKMKTLKPQDLLTSRIKIQDALMLASPSYVTIMEEMRSKLNLLPPSSAMAGVYTLVDNSRGVWKAPANVSIAMVNAPSKNVSNEQQENMNVDVISGKSVNAIRIFPGMGTLVWGARTLDGNSQDWRYINVRRTMLMIEQSLKLAARAYIFEPNDSGTWVTVQSMMNNFLINLWKQGALIGAEP